MEKYQMCVLNFFKYIKYLTWKCRRCQCTTVITQKIYIFFKILCCLLGSGIVLWSKKIYEFETCITLSQIPCAPHHPTPIFLENTEIWTWSHTCTITMFNTLEKEAPRGVWPCEHPNAVLSWKENSWATNKSPLNLKEKHNLSTHVSLLDVAL